MSKKSVSLFAQFLIAFALGFISHSSAFAQESCPSWKDEAILYGVAPHYASDREGKRFQDITRRIPTIKRQGINTLWIQPIQENFGKGQGYDVTNYYGIWPDLGSSSDLKTLVKTAHNNGLRVIFDFVANHTSIEHPYAKDVIARGKRSPYYDWYMHAPDDAPYSWFYQSKNIGGVDFFFYFWDQLVNLNFDSKDVREHLIGATEHWVRDFDIDGYRFDAAWGPHSRRPDFFPEMKRRLLKIKKDLLLLAEDKPMRPEAYEGLEHPSPAEIFDMTYDWTRSRDYVSEWAWQTDTPDITIFNSVGDDERVEQLRRVLGPSLDREAGQARVLRFLENNDTPRFHWNHSLPLAHALATLIFTLPGNPLVYYGQEVAIDEHYPTFEEIDTKDKADGSVLSRRYRELAKLRASRPELNCGDYHELELEEKSSPGRVFGFERSLGEHVTRVLINLSSRAASVRVLGDDADQTKWITLKAYEARTD